MSFPQVMGKPKISEALKIKIRKAAAARRALLKKKSVKMMPFVPQLSQSVIAGRTVVSFRLNMYPFYPKPGQEFVAHCAHSPLPGKYICRKRLKTTMKRVRDDYWRQVGMASPGAYEELMKEILHQPELKLETKGFLYVFERIE